MHPVASRGANPRTTTARIVAIIPARHGSTRLPGKPLLEIAGRPMIEHVYRRAASAPSVDRVIVATDDDRIMRAVAAFGGDACLTSPAHRSGTDRLAEVAASLDCDIVVNVQGDEPLIAVSMIQEAIDPVAASSDVVMSTVRRRIDDPEDYDDPNVVKVVVDAKGDALYFSRAPIPWVRGAPSDAWRAHGAAAFKHMGLYVYQRDFLLHLATLPPTPLELAESLEQLRVLEHGFRIRTVETTCDSLSVDTPDDLARVRALVAAEAR